MSETNVPSEGALSIDQATAALMNPPAVEVEEAPEAAADDAPEADNEIPEGGETDPSEYADHEGDVEPPEGEEEGETEPEPVAALDAPAYWSKEAKADFAELSPKMQAVVLAQEGPREAAAAKAKADAAIEVKAAREQSQQVQTLAEQLATFLPEAVETFKERWGEPDWEATIRQYGAQEAAILKARYDKEQGQIAQLAKHTQEAQTKAFDAYQIEQIGVLATLDSELVPDATDPVKGAEKRLEVTNYLLSQGVGRDAVKQISALEMSISRKAMLWDQAEAARKAGNTGQQRPAQQQQRRVTPKPGARPAGSAAASPQAQGRLSVQNAFNAKPSIDNAVALLLARQGSR